MINIKSKVRRIENPLNALLSSAKSRAKRNGIEFNLTLDHLEKLWNYGKCELSGLEFEKKPSSRYNQGPFRPSLDRIDNNAGYVVGNVRIILWALNLAINGYGIDTYLKIAKAVVKHKCETEIAI